MVCFFAGLSNIAKSLYRVSAAPCRILKNLAYISVICNPALILPKFSTLVNCYFMVSFDLKVILYIVQMTYYILTFCTRSQFSLVFNLSGSAEHVDNSDESVSEEVLRKAMEYPQDEASLYISDEEMSQV